MRVWRWAVAMVVGSGLATTVVLWPVRPKCVVTLASANQLVGFGPAGCEVAVQDDDRLRWFDAAIGRLTRETPLDAPPGWRCSVSALAPDGERVDAVCWLAGQAASEERFVFDARTGATRLGPLPGAEFLTFSPCGRWLACGGSFSAVTLRDAATGKPLAAVNDSVSICFAADGDHLAVLRWLEGGSDIIILECRTGVTVRRIALPQDKLSRFLRAWDASGLCVNCDDSTCSVQSGGHRAYVLDPWAASPTPRRAPLRDAVDDRGFDCRCESGPGWIVRLTDPPQQPQWVEDAVSHVRDFVGRPITDVALPRTETAWRYDAATGRLLSKVAGLPEGGIVSPDGRRIACLDRERNELTVWTLAPWPRWPFALAAGAAPLAIAWLLGRRKRRAA